MHVYEKHLSLGNLGFGYEIRLVAGISKGNYGNHYISYGKQALIREILIILGPTRCYTQELWDFNLCVGKLVNCWCKSTNIKGFSSLIGYCLDLTHQNTVS